MNKNGRASLVVGLVDHGVEKIENIKETEYSDKMASLNETKLICWAIKICLIPCMLISALATFFPYPQAIVPVHES